MTPVLIEPARQDFAFRTRDTPVLGVILDGMNIESLEVMRLPLLGQVIEWTIAWPGAAPVTKTTAENGGLVTDQRFGAIYWPIQASDLATVKGGPAASYWVTAVEGDGRRTTYLTGTIIATE